MAKDNVDIGKLIDEETERRLQIMEDPNYAWPEKAGKWDVIAIITALVISGALILACMLGVIE